MAHDHRFAPLVGFKSDKAAQIAAFFAAHQPGIEKLKLIKLIYLAERAFLAQHGHPMLYDELFSMKDGPVCSAALNGINGRIDTDKWTKFISMKSNRYVKANLGADRDLLDEVSDAELAVLNNIWDEFGHMSASQIRKWTHDNCPEYTEIDHGRVPISYASVFKALGENQLASELEKRINYSRKVDSLLST